MPDAGQMHDVAFPDTRFERVIGHARIALIAPASVPGVDELERAAGIVIANQREGVAALFRKSRARVIIHGHTHRPARHVEPGGIRWVLPDWDLDHGMPRGGYLRVDAEGIHAMPLD